MSVVEFFLDNGYLISPDILDRMNNDNKTSFLERVEDNIKGQTLVVVNKDVHDLILKKNFLGEVNWREFEKSRFLFEKGRDNGVYQAFLGSLYGGKPQFILSQESSKGVVSLKSYNKKSIKRTVQDFVSYYKIRYNFLRKVLMNRSELQNTVSITRLLNKNEREEVSLIGLVMDKNTTKNGNILIKLEDITGEISVLINKNKNDLYKVAKDIVLDEVVGIKGMVGNKIVFANDIYFPGIPVSNIAKKSKEEVYAVFTSDIHLGSNEFLEKNFLKFIDWLNGNLGNDEQKEISEKVKYLFIVGDTVDGVGVYPTQEEDLTIKDVIKQYDKLAEYLGKIRKDIAIIMCGGQHDALRLAEPQPIFDEKYAKSVLDLPNVVPVSNPALVNIHKKEDFDGFDILMYHGASFHYYVDNVESLIVNNSRDNPRLILNYLLQKRHLSPTHESGLYIPDSKEDFLIIDKVPDVLVCGEMHRTDVASFNNVITLNCSCWQSKTDFQEKTGNNPDPGKVPVLNLKTREVRIMNFGVEDGNK